MSFLKTAGVVIKEVNTGDADKVLTIFTKSNGRITAYAKGARRPKSSFAAAAQFMSYSEYILFSGKDMYSVNSGEVIESFYEIRNDLVKLTYAAHFMEIVGDIIQENQPSGRLLQLLLNSLHMLSKTEKPPELIARIFEMRALTIAGYAPYLKNCVVCGGESAEGFTFSFKNCGLLCGRESCRASDLYSLEVSGGALKALQHIVYSNIKTLFSFNLSEQVLEELGIINRRYVRERLEKDYSKLDFIKNL